MAQKPDTGHAKHAGQLTHCAVCHRTVLWTDGEALSAYWTIAHDGLLIRLCPACHTPNDGGVYVVIPATATDR